MPPAPLETSITPRAPVRTRTFIDLRRFAAEAAANDQPRPRGAGSWLGGRHLLDLPPGPVSVAALSLGEGCGAVAQLPGDEFVFVLSGDLTIGADDATLTLGPDSSAVLPAGGNFAWRTTTGVQVLIMRHAGPASDGAKPLVIEERGALAASNPPLAELLVGPTPQCRNRTDYRSADGAFTSGVWDSTPYHRLSMPYRHYELMHLLAGAVTFEDGDGRRATFSAGDVFLVEQGAECSWLSVSDVTKVFAIYRPV